MRSNSDRKTAVLQARLERLREEFDSSFAEPLKSLDLQKEQLLCFSAGGARYAMSMADLQSLARCASVTPVPSRAPALLGLAVVRAQVVPVYSLTRLTGLGAQDTQCHWLAILRGTAACALGLETVEGYAAGNAIEFTVAGSDSQLVNGAVKHSGHLYAVVHGAEIYDIITRAGSEEGKG